MRPPRLRCTLFPLIYPPHLLGSYKRQLYGFVLFSRLTKQNLASYVISVRRTKSLLTASFRFYLTIDTLAVQLYTSLSPRRVRDFHPLERAHGAQTKISPAIAWLTIQKFIIFYCPLDGEHTNLGGTFIFPFSAGLFAALFIKKELLSGKWSGRRADQRAAVLGMVPAKCFKLTLAF